MFVIVLSADYSYAEHVLTTIKSVCYYHQNIRFYLLNKDFPEEWFDILNQHLSVLDCQIHDVKIHHEFLQHYPTFSHITEATFYRYFIPTLIPDDKVLYLDCDLVVNGGLDALFHEDLQDYFVAAVRDPIAKYHQMDEFNAGVMLINNRLWKETDMTGKCLALTRALGSQLQNGDQEVLNVLLKDKYLELNRGYNYQVGMDYILSVANQAHLIEDLGGVVPYIVHYSTRAKPWLPQTLTRFRHLYWFYYQLSWQEIAAQHQAKSSAR